VIFASLLAEKIQKILLQVTQGGFQKFCEMYKHWQKSTDHKDNILKGTIKRFLTVVGFEL
jgi:hypothetical protein